MSIHFRSLLDVALFDHKTNMKNAHYSSIFPPKPSYSNWCHFFWRFWSSNSLKWGVRHIANVQRNVTETHAKFVASPLTQKLHLRLLLLEIFFGWRLQVGNPCGMFHPCAVLCKKFLWWYLFLCSRFDFMIALLGHLYLSFTFKTIRNGAKLLRLLIKKKMKQLRGNASSMYYEQTE